MGRLLKETDFDGKETIYHYSDTSGELQRSIELAKVTQGLHNLNTAYKPLNSMQWDD